MTKTLAEECQDLATEAEAVSNDVRGFKAKILAEYPGFSYEKLKADQLGVYAKLKRVEARMDKAVGKSLFYLIKLNETWWNLFFQGLVKQEQFGAEIAHMKRIYDMGRAH